MRWFALLLLLAVAPADAKKPKKEPAPAPVPAAPVPVAPALVQLPCNYVPGTVWRFQVEDTTIDVGRGAPDGRIVSRQQMDVHVDTWDGTLLTAHVVLAKAEYVEPPTDPVLRAITEKFLEIEIDGPVRIEYAHRTGLRVTNVEDLHRWRMAALESIAPLLEQQAAKLPPEGAQRFRELVYSSVDDPGIQSDAFVVRGLPMFGYTCFRQPPGSHDFESEVHNMYGGPMFPAHGTLVIQPPVDGQVRVVETAVADPVRAIEILRQTFEAGGAPPPTDPEERGFVASTRIEVSVDAADGWPVSWVNERRNGLGDWSKVERSAVTRISE